MSNQHAEHTPDRKDEQAEHTEQIEQAGQSERTGQVEQVEAFYTDVKRLGHWTRSRTIEVRTRRASVHLDLRSAQIPEGEIELRLNSERSTLKLLLPEDAVLQESGLALAGRCKIKDRERHTGHSGRVVRLTGTLQHSEIRVARGGVATLSAMFSREFLDDARTAHRDGTEPVLPDPGKDHEAPQTDQQHEPRTSPPA